jgi:endoglucanase
MAEGGLQATAGRSGKRGRLSGVGEAGFRICVPQALLVALAALLAILQPDLGLASGAAGDAGPKFRHGVNVTRLFDTPRLKPGAAREYDIPPFKPWRQQVSAAELGRLRGAGFDFIRLPIDPGPFLALAQGERDRALHHLFDFVAAARAADFGVVLDLHPRPDNKDWNAAALLRSLDGDKFERFKSLVVLLAQRLAERGDPRVALELFNEPQRECTRRDGPDWTSFQRELLRAVRAAATDVPVVVTPGCLSSVDGLAHLDADTVAGPHVYLMIHFYEPHAFTHQGASWSPPARLLAGLSFPIEAGDRDAARQATDRWIAAPEGGASKATPEQRQFAERTIDTYFARPVTGATIRERLGVVAAWADRAGLPRSQVMIGEFGVLRSGGIRMAPDPDAARAAWLRAVVSASDELGFSWAVWGYDGAFGIVSEDAERKLEPFTLDALFGPRG